MPVPAKSLTAARCLGRVSTAFIAPDGGRPNIAAKTLATLWYVLIVPDAQSRLQRHVHHKRMPWYAPSRIFGIVLAAANIVTMPLSWGLLFAGKKNASRLATLGVLLNPPSIQLSTLLISELSAALVKKSLRLVRGAGALVAKPFKKKDAAEETPQIPETTTTTPPTTTPTTTATTTETPAETKPPTTTTETPAETKPSATTTEGAAETTASAATPASASETTTPAKPE